MEMMLKMYSLGFQVSVVGAFSKFFDTRNYDEINQHYIAQLIFIIYNY